MPRTRCIHAARLCAKRAASCCPAATKKGLLCSWCAELLHVLPALLQVDLSGEEVQAAFDLLDTGGWLVP